MSRARLMLLLASAGIMSGCAGVKHVAVPVEPRFLSHPGGKSDAGGEIARRNVEIDQRNRAADDATTGIRYYRSSPYVLVYSDGHGSIKWEILSLPDPFRKLAAEPFDDLASLSFRMEFKDGAVTTTETADSTAMPKAIIDAVKDVLPAFIAAAANEGKAAEAEHRLPAPLLYKIVQDAQARIRFVGGPRPSDVFVTIVPTVPQPTK